MRDTESLIHEMALTRARQERIPYSVAYQRLLSENPGLYQDYLDERESHMLSSKSKREYLAQLATKFAAQGRGTEAYGGKLAPLPAGTK